MDEVLEDVELEGRGTEDSTAANTSSSDSESDVVCPTCKRPESVDEENTEWVQCDNSSCCHAQASILWTTTI